MCLRRELSTDTEYTVYGNYVSVYQGWCDSETSVVTLSKKELQDLLKAIDEEEV